MTVGRRRNWKNRSFLKQRKPKIVSTEQLKYIQLLHERGEGSPKISKRLGPLAQHGAQISGAPLQRRLKEQLGLAV